MYAKSKTIFSFNPLKAGLLAVMGMVLLAALPVSAFMAESEPRAHVSVSGMTATAEFTLGSPCSPYVVEWGDGTKVEQETSEEIMCIQVLQDMMLDHTYETEGTYTVSLTFSGKTTTNTVTVPANVRMFGLTDVESVTSLWVDPNEMMADEEYTLYTITLKDDTVVEVKAGGFTTQEWREQQFLDAGYTGDVSALIAVAVPIEEEKGDDDASNTEEDEVERRNLQSKIIELLNKLISLLRR